jgi:hypothetical protein
MRHYTCIDFTGHYDVPVAAVVYAANKAEAANYLNNALQGQGLPGDALEENMIPFADRTSGVPNVRILSDGDY